MKVRRSETRVKAVVAFVPVEVVDVGEVDDVVVKRL